MKIKIFILGVRPPPIEGGSKAVEMNSPIWYALGALVALFFTHIHDTLFY